MLNSENMKSVATNGFATYYHEVGSADDPVVIALHGSGAGVSAAANWSYFLPDLAARGFRVIAPDVVGFGATVPNREYEYGDQAWVDWLAAFVDATNVSQAHLVGNSFGGWLSMRFALDHRETVASLVLMGTGGVARTKSPARLENERYVTPSLEGMRSILQNFVYHKELITDELVAVRYEASAAPGAPERFAAVKAARDRDVRASPLIEMGLESLDVPTLLVHGKDDQIIPYGVSVELLGILPQSELIVFDRCGHWNMLEDPPRFNAVVADFLSHTVS